MTQAKEVGTGSPAPGKDMVVTSGEVKQAGTLGTRTGVEDPALGLGLRGATRNGERSSRMEQELPHARHAAAETGQLCNQVPRCELSRC